MPCGPIRNRSRIPGRSSFIGVPFFANGQQLGQLVEQGCKGINGCKVAVAAGPAELPLEKLRTRRLNSVIKKDKNIHIVSIQAGGYLAAPALKATQNILQAHPRHQRDRLER